MNSGNATELEKEKEKLESQIRSILMDFCKRHGVKDISLSAESVCELPVYPLDGTKKFLTVNVKSEIKI